MEMGGGARRRLLADLRELERRALPLVSARPLEDDIFTWHCNIIGPENTAYAGGLFHFVLSFPPTYPNRPPSARVFSPIPHPHVHGDLICLDLLSDYASYFLSVDQGEKVLGTGWSSAYSVQTILLQMQAFLMELGDEQEREQEGEKMPTLDYYLQRIPQAIKEARAFACSVCPHGPDAPWPPLVLIESSIPRSEKDIIREELVCFHSKRHFTEDCLGMPLSIQYYNNGRTMKHISTDLDLLSYTSFAVEGVRHTVLGDRFSHWLPLYINEEHAKRAVPLLKFSLSAMFTGREDKFDPQMAFDVLTKLCNTMVVNVMAQKTHASIKALTCVLSDALVLKIIRGYCAFQSLVDQFVADERGRSKKAVPALGEFLPLLTLTTKRWRDIAHAYLAENFDRNVRWILQKHPKLADNSGRSPLERDRVELTFKATIVSVRLLLFHVYFLETVACPEGMTLQEIAGAYDALYGCPSLRMQEDLQRACHQIQQVSSWEEFFQRIGVTPPSQEELAKWFRQAVGNSLRKGYHGPPRRTGSQSGVRTASIRPASSTSSASSFASTTAKSQSQSVRRPTASSRGRGAGTRRGGRPKRDR